jgi:hypothetical protein
MAKKAISVEASKKLLNTFAGKPAAKSMKPE